MSVGGVMVMKISGWHRKDSAAAISSCPMELWGRCGGRDWHKFVLSLDDHDQINQILAINFY